MVAKPTVFVIDDDPGALRSLCWLIQQADLPVQAFRSGREFFDSWRPQEQEAGCLIVDCRMPEMTGLEVQEHLSEQGSKLPIIFITAHGDVPTCAKALKAGAMDFLEKPVDGKTLLDRIQEALARSTVQKGQTTASEFTARVNQLTPREKAVLDMLVAGKSLKQIAIVNNVTVQTIWKHRVSVFRKMGVENDAALIRLTTQCEYLLAKSPESPVKF